MEINPFSATLPNLEKITHPDDFFQSVKEQYSSQVRNGYFYHSGGPAFYIQQIESPSHSYLGIIATVPIQAYRKGLIKGHEETLEHKGRIQVELLRERQAMVKPVLLTYSRVDAIEDWMRQQITELKPIQSVFFEQDQANYRLWEVLDTARLQEIQLLFQQEVHKAYIADGHHRMLCATADDLQLSSVFCSFYPQDQVLIRDFNRQVFVPPDFDAPHFLQKLKSVAHLRPLYHGAKPIAKHQVSLYIKNQWYTLRWRDQIVEQNNDLPLLDAAILNQDVLQSLLGVEDLRKTDKVKYIDGQKGISDLEALLQKNENSLLFCLYPVDWSEMVQWADQGRTLPPKSTWFEPRMKNGLVVQDL